MAARLSSVRRCFSNGCRERIFVKMSAVLSSVGTVLDRHAPSAPHLTHFIELAVDVWRECCAEVRTVAKVVRALVVRAALDRVVR